MTELEDQKQTEDNNQKQKFFSRKDEYIDFNDFLDDSLEETKENYLEDQIKGKIPSPS